ncbi:hypothetical protein L1987_09842 [Smallanthus sonchifolius]|uniref:Uncharacterized protein n=1 Tax=Smallanthus sonchifolius TaxID=185202 RepID=A0ACB9JQF7_9ASTR|nr:hypothetical protein L1987_09842 [Smallanthus sonchifolius]
MMSSGCAERPDEGAVMRYVLCAYIYVFKLHASGELWGRRILAWERFTRIGVQTFVRECNNDNDLKLPPPSRHIPPQLPSLLGPPPPGGQSYPGGSSTSPFVGFSSAQPSPYGVPPP